MKDLAPICLDIYRQLFKEAVPSGDFDELVRRGITKQEGFFDDYYLDQDRQDAIVKEHCEKHHLNRVQSDQVYGTVALGCSPRGVKRDPGYETCNCVGCM